MKKTKRIGKSSRRFRPAKTSKPPRRAMHRPSWKTVATEQGQEITRLVEEIRQKVSRSTWNSSEGLVFMDNVDEGHLRNAISYVGRRLVAELGMTTYVDSLGQRAQDFHHLLQEAKRRGIRV